MIRRETESEWILITQIEHAKLAAVIAKLWREVDSKLLNDALMFAVEHHDNGWEQWDSNPVLDEKFGKPVSFTEMSFFDTSQIWSEGIESCAQHSPESGLLASQHFVWLAEHVAHNEGKEKIEREHASRFIQQQLKLQYRWLESLKTETRDQLHSRLEVLQLMDRISLWICCDPSEKPASPMKSQHHPIFSLSQYSTEEIKIQNFPGLDSPLSLEVRCNRIPIEATRNMDLLCQEIFKGHTDKINWRLSPI